VNRRYARSYLLLVLTVCALSARTRPAGAAPKDAAALKMADDAINNDYLATNFADAEKKLRRANTLCGPSGCSPQTRARIFRDLGVVLVAGQNRPADGRNAFAEALKLDPNITLEKDLTTPEVEQAFQAAKGSAPASPGGQASAAAGGDMIHTPPAEQVVLTPVPIYVELPDGLQAAKVTARYRPFGAPEWKTVELRRISRGYGGEIPCLDVGSTTGDLAYYLVAVDASGEVVATSGTRAAPNKVAIRTELGGEPPHLPGRSAPAACRDVADCPPGLPGCPSRRSVGKGSGASCEQDSECGPGLACKGGTCQTGDKGSEAAPSKPCDNTSDCASGETCNSDKLCQAPPSYKKTWLSVSVQQDFILNSEQREVCGLQHTSQFICTDQDGFLYSGTPQSAPGTGDALTGGLRRATTRFMVGIDHLLGAHVSVGARLGYALNVAEPSFVSSMHAEARALYWFGSAPFQQSGLRPFLGVAAGLASMDAKFSVPILESAATVDPVRGRPRAQDLGVFRKAGPGFGGIVAGVMIPFGAGHGLLVEMRGQLLFPNSGFGLSPAIGYAFGL
jgi:hypothetical protein